LLPALDLAAQQYLIITKVYNMAKSSKKIVSKGSSKPLVSRSTEEKKLAALLKEALEILDKGSMFGIDWKSTGEYYTKAYTYMQKLGYCG
jgi:hypothetical protein